MVKHYKQLIIFISFALIIIVLIFITLGYAKPSTAFDGQSAYNDVKYQVSLGPRTMGSVAHEQAAQWIITELQTQNWQIETQETVISGQMVKNIIAKRGTGNPWVIFGSHYDSRAMADQDPDLNNQKQPVMGANDGASSVAILLEFARVIPITINKQIWLVFFDDEDNGTYSGTGWGIGSDYFVSQLEDKPDNVIILDMVGDKDLNIYMEKNSNPELNDEIWGVAERLGYDQFIPTYKYDLIDDHTAFLQAGIKAVDVIDFNYPYWHTTQDTLDKVSERSLKIVGQTILTWLEQFPK
jgi:glutaminyl-peptide cyclotransferase